MKAFACSYRHDGADWAVTIHARDWKDAMERCEKLGYLKLDGEIIATVPAQIGIFVRFICWLRNLFC